MGKVWEATQTWERLKNRLGKVREGKVLHGKTLGRVWDEVLFIVHVTGTSTTHGKLAPFHKKRTNHQLGCGCKLDSKHNDC